MTAPTPDRGIATIWTLSIVGACMLMVGLVLDGGTVLRARSSSFDLAGGAARAGAQELDQQALTEGRVILDPEAARTTALAWLAARDVTGVVVVDEDVVTVTVRSSVHLQILQVATVTVEETASAQAQRGRPAP
ncbi:MAG: pilus assembly protein TadG-related protein [Acidimicrobiales bacterium]